MPSSYYTDKVLITGASGFVAAHIIDQLFARGLEIVGTVRSAEKGDWLAKRFPGFKYEIVKDLTDAKSVASVFKKHSDIKYVLHVASPAGFFQSDFIKNLVDPAVNATKSLLQAAHNHGHNVKKFVVTSSVASVYPTYIGAEHPEITITEDSWIDLTLDQAEENWFSGYSASKKFAEKALWDFKETQKPRFPVSAIVITGCYGPPIHDVTYSTLGSSVSMFRDLLNTPVETKEIPTGISGHVDVRDAARIHVNALFDSRYDNARWLVMDGRADQQTMLDIIHKYRPIESADIAVGIPSSFNEKLFYKFDNSKTLMLLDFELIPFEKSVIDMFDAVRLLKEEEEKAVKSASQ